MTGVSIGGGVRKFRFARNGGGKTETEAVKTLGEVLAATYRSKR